MDNNCFFSILIPVYNVEKYLEKCLDSVYSQTFKDFEVIIMIDGSTDSSQTICEKFSARDSRFKVYYQKNQGLLLTRRNSLALAKGNYILFLDSDDYYDVNLLERVYDVINKFDCDLILFRFNRILDDGQFYKKDIDVFKSSRLFINNEKITLWEKFIDSGRLNNIWAKVAKKEIIDIGKDYSKFHDKKGEDILQSLPLIHNSKRAYYLNEALYNYRMSSSGRGRNFQVSYLEDFFEVRRIMLEYMKLEGMTKVKHLQMFYTSYALSFLNLTKNISLINFPMLKKVSILEKVLTNKESLIDEAKKNIDYRKFSFTDKKLFSFLINKKYYTFLFTLSVYNFIKKIYKMKILPISRHVRNLILYKS